MVNRRGRRSIRLPGCDYTQPGAYFVTICTHERQDLFGVVTLGDVRLSAAGKIASRCWARIPFLFTEIKLDSWVVMPNHIHGIVVIGGRGEAFDVEDPGIPAPGPLIASPLPSPARGTRPGSLASTIQNYKSIATRKINQARSTPGAPVWQRNYYEHVIRGEGDLRRTREYILANPSRWQGDPGDIPGT